MNNPNKRARESGSQPATSALPLAISPPQKRARRGVVKSPFQLTRIHGLPEKANKDTVTLEDLVGDPLLKECWQFNYLHDIDFIMEALDEDVRHLVKVHVVHGFWKSEDPNRRKLQNQAVQYKNVELHAAYLPEMFGTHHSKMMILLKHDDTAQVVIHTANMIERDWRNMSQAVWRSPPLPLLAVENSGSQEAGGEFPVGSGLRFKVDLLNYLRAYNDKRLVCTSIIETLARYDFESIKGALIASVPGRHDAEDSSETHWGWSAMKNTLRAVPTSQQGEAAVVVQVSSIATLGPTDKWLRETLFKSLSSSKRPSSSQDPEFKVVFPTSDEIRRSLDGYASGASIHTKIQSSQQAKQLEYLRPIFCHWANDSARGMELPGDHPVKEAGRKRAAPHIKTYIRYTKDLAIDWALVTSANLSKQAWGDAAKPSGEFRISSYEIGVLVWPALFAADSVMKPTFGADEPSGEDVRDGEIVVGVRVPYDMPLQRYSKDEVPWVATLSHSEPDWMGQVWEQNN
ncbi:phospholipase D/nuclease [Thozetella sp. PMI_491]|nr:phospholipase D/nuclease [Thozetella sp. PMI_491]